MPSSWDGGRKIIWAKELDDMQVIGSRMFSVGVPVDADPIFKTYMFAAGVTHSMGNKSIDGQLRRNYDAWLHRHLPDQLLPEGSTDRLLYDIRAIAIRRCSELSELDLGRGAIEGTCSAANALLRLEASFSAAVQLIRLGYAYESEAVTRSGFEQVMWSYRVFEFADSNQAVATNPTACTAKLKDIFPGAGRIYNRLSNLAHVAPSTYDRVVAAKEGKLWVHIRSPAAAIESAFYLVVLLDAFLVVCEKIFRAHGLACANIDSASGAPLRHRQAAQMIEVYSQVLPRDANDIFRVWLPTSG